MRRIAYAALALLLATAQVVAQVPYFPQSLPAGTVIGRTSNAGPGPTEAIPLSTLATQLSSSLNPLPNVADRTVYVSTGGNDSNNGLTRSTPKLTIQAAINAAGTGGDVLVGSGTYTLTSPLTMQPGVRVLCNDGATLTQGNNANLVSLVDFNVNSANGASLERCTIDGNRVNNTDSLNVFCISVAIANDVTIRGNIIRNCNGYGVNVGTGLRPLIVQNRISNFYQNGISVITNTAGLASYARIEDNILTAPIGGHAITLVNADFSTVRENVINAGTLVGGTGSFGTGATNVNTSGTTVTFASGVNFANVVAGQFVVLNAGQEFQIQTVNSSTSLTVTSALPTLSNTPAVIGTGDMVSIVAASQVSVINNIVVGGATQGIAYSSGANGESASNSLIKGNHVLRSGEMCIGVSQVTSSVFNISVVGNELIDCGQSTVADGAAVSNAGIFVLGASTFNIFVDSNFIADDQPTATISWWLGVSLTPAGGVTVGKNGFQRPLNNGVTGDVTSISLAAGWGSTATTSAIVSQGDSVSFTITSSGTGQAANPQVTINKLVARPEIPPLIECKFVGGTGTLQAFFGEASSTAGQWITNYFGTPVAASTYIVICK